jgi:urease accessory protein
MIATVIPMKKRETKSGKIIVDGKVRLLFEVDSTGDTQLKDLYQSDPLRVLFPNTDNNDIIQAALVNISGGLVGGDQIFVDIQLGENTKALIVGQSAEKVYRSLGLDAKVGIKVKVGAGSWIEFLPQETILFEGSRLRRHTHIDIEGDGCAMAGEIMVFGRRAYGEYFENGLINDSWEVVRDGRLVWADILHMDKNIASIIKDPACFDGAGAMATVIYAGPDAEDNLSVVQNLLAVTNNDVLSSVTCVNGVMIIRWLGKNALDLRTDFGAFWRAFRNKIADLPSKLPRLWDM